MQRRAAQMWSVWNPHTATSHPEDLRGGSAAGLRPLSRVSSFVTVASASAMLARECGASRCHFISAYATAC